MLRGDLRQADLALAFDAIVAGRRVDLRSARAQAGAGTLAGSGTIDLDAPRAFSIKARASNFDPSRFVAAPPAQLDGMVDAKRHAGALRARRLDHRRQGQPLCRPRRGGHGPRCDRARCRRAISRCTRRSARRRSLSRVVTAGRAIRSRTTSTFRTSRSFARWPCVTQGSRCPIRSQDRCARKRHGQRRSRKPGRHRRRARRIAAMGTHRSRGDARRERIDRRGAHRRQARGDGCAADQGTHRCDTARPRRRQRSPRRASTRAERSPSIGQRSPRSGDGFDAAGSIQGGVSEIRRASASAETAWTGTVQTLTNRGLYRVRIARARTREHCARPLHDRRRARRRSPTVTSTSRISSSTKDASPRKDRSPAFPVGGVAKLAGFTAPVRFHADRSAATGRSRPHRDCPARSRCRRESGDWYGTRERRRSTPPSLRSASPSSRRGQVRRRRAHRRCALPLPARGHDRCTVLARGGARAGPHRHARRRSPQA